MRRSLDIAIVAIVAALPRLLVLGVERGAILEDFTEKSDRFASTLVASGTFGFLPGRPSAYTQPLYAWFLAAIYQIDRHWVLVGLAQTAVAVATALVVYAIGRHLASRAVGLVAACIATLEPFHVWHDIHVNREILDGLAAAGLTLLALLAYERRSLWLAGAAGATTGVAILGNARLAALPLVIAAYVAWGLPWRRALGAAAVVVATAALVVTPWIVRNAVVVGCATLTTDARALWKANNSDVYDILARGGWIDDVPEPPGGPPWPELAADLTLAGTPTQVDECEQSRYYRELVFDFWREQPGEKGRLAAQATWMLWSPFFSVDTDDEQFGTIAEIGRDLAQPLFVVALYALALGGAFVAPRRFVALAVLLLAYQTLAAAVFAGTVRYRAPWDFLLALLAAHALLELARRARARRAVPTSR